jgi:hypothetical protein
MSGLPEFHERVAFAAASQNENIFYFSIIDIFNKLIAEIFNIFCLINFNIYSQSGKDMRAWHFNPKTISSSGDMSAAGRRSAYRICA